MTGVEILASKEIVVETVFNWTAFWICAGIVFVFFIAMGLFLSVNENNYSNLFICFVIGIGMGVLFGSILGVGFGTPAAYETQYDVIISPEVSMAEFYERYEVIEQDGRIFTIREK